MSSWLVAALAVGSAYLLGSIPFGLVLARARGVDIREHGSGNIGATNVARNLGKALGALVLLLDALKGAAPMLALGLLGLDEQGPSWLIPATGLAAIAGHCFPVWLRFRGGKGVATALGVLVVVDPVAMALCLGVFVLVVLVLRIVSLGSLLAAVLVPVVGTLLDRPWATISLGIGAAVIIVFKHRDNIQRLRRGEESRF